jgi:transposase-like protein
MDEPSNARPKRGRRRALDEVKRREVCALISAGSAIADAARYVGCAASTIHREAMRNPEFREHLRRANLTNE